ncbi:MAG TPA: phosphoribosylformylglycinamidine synthase subunit PurL [Gemmataceae bacterium]|nr:phosphoribosylformylglycinamidine synthase subunit PurL [Gemmataceae bacterium]
MLWEVEIQPLGQDPERKRVCQEYVLYTQAQQGADIVTRSAKGFLLEGNLHKKQVEQLMAELLVDRLTEVGRAEQIGENGQRNGSTGERLTVLLKPGVMDPAAMSVLDAAHDLEFPVESVRTFRRYYIDPKRYASQNGAGGVSFYKVLANDAIEQIVVGPLAAEHLTLGEVYFFQRVTIPLIDLDDAGLMRLSRQAQLSLSLAEMLAIQTHFRSLGREPTDVELETLAQTWSEHCSHKTLKGEIDCDGRRFHNLLKETIFGATQEIRRRLGRDDWCVSVFEDNAGVVRFDDRYHVCFKVETHNHPSAIEPYGGANTGLGGVIRDPLGTGLGAKPICNTDVFCFGLPDTAPESLPPGVLHPVRVIRGVVAGVRDYGNRMGIPTVNGAVCFDDRYLANPLVFCGTVGLIPVEHSNKRPLPGDLIVAVGGRTGRDGIHGATFSSIELTAESEKVSGGAVQIGNAITEKKLLDVLLQARDRGQFHAITDCGAGGFSSAIGEMAEKLGATVHLDQAPLKYQGLSYTEIWISEAQERMILAVPPENWPALQRLCASEDVEATAIGRFEATSRLRLYYKENQVADLDMDFLHNGRPPVVRRATCRAAGMSPSRERELGRLTPSVPARDLTDTLFKILTSYNVCSKEWIIRQYDHEVQGGTVIKPLVGVRHEGPGDAAVIMPVLGSWTGLAVGCGLNPRYGILDPYRMATAAVDEAVRNVVAVGADPARIALLDNFCWGNTDRPEVLGSLVRAAEACRDVALAYGMPFISGKDSLNNEFRAGELHITIPPTLLISALGRIEDVRRCITMDLKEPGNLLFLIGSTKDEMGGSHYNLVNRLEHGLPPEVDLNLAPAIFIKLHEAIERGLVRSCHDLSEGGLAVAAAEMAFAGNIGADLTYAPRTPAPMTDDIELFSESTTRFLVEVAPAQVHSLKECFVNLPLAEIGKTCSEPRLRIAGTAGEWIVTAKLGELKEAWQKTLRW